MDQRSIARLRACSVVLSALALVACGPDRSGSLWTYDASDAPASSDARRDGGTLRAPDGSAPHDVASPSTDSGTTQDVRPVGVCDAPRIRCGSDCIDASANASHCGACGNACPREQTCSAGSCVATTTDTGAPCGSDAACGSSSGACITPSYGWPGGYCIYGCRSNADCPGSGYCNTRATTPYCLRSCTEDSECRTGYQCVPVSETQGICYPRCRSNAALICGAYRCDPDFDVCDTSPCSADSDCSSGSRCDTSTSRCGCTAATDCGTGFACVTSTGRCGCASDSVCGTGRRCDVATGRCL